MCVIKSKRRYIFVRKKSTDKAGITYHDVRSLADELGREICHVILCFHALTGSDFTFPFYYRSKITVFRKMLKTKDSWKLLESMLSDHPNIKDITEFVLRIVYNMLKTKKKDKQRRNIYPSGKSLPPDQSSLKM